MQIQFDFTKNISKKKLQDFADIMRKMQESIDFKVSARGWGYLMEQAGYINKSQFDKVENAVNRCRKEGLLPVDFIAEEQSRMFHGIIKPSEGTVRDTLIWMLKDVLNGAHYFKPDWWQGEKYYIQMVVEKIDLLTLFEPVCAKYKIPIANAKGWQSILQRADYARRFKEAEDMGLKCVLLYCGDHDPDGKRISETMRKNIKDVADVYWTDGEEGYDPDGLIIDRFGLEYDFIIKQGYTWIDNLITGGDKNLADPKHRNFKLPYVQEYLKEVGERKCEANVLVTTPAIGRQLCDEAILAYLGEDAPRRFEAKRLQVEQDYQRELETTGLIIPINKILSDEDEE
jgi:hypothetical protein